MGELYDYRSSLPSPIQLKRHRSRSFTKQNSSELLEVLRTLRTMPVCSTQCFNSPMDDEDIDEEEYEDRPISQTFSCNVITVIFPNGSQTSIIIGEEDHTLEQVRARLERQNSIRGFSFAYTVGNQTFYLTYEQEQCLFKDLLMTTNIRASIRDESLCLTLAFPTSESHFLDKADNHLIREYVQIWVLAIGEVHDRIFLLRQGRVDLYQSEMVLMQMDGQIDIRVRLKDVQRLQLLRGEPNTVVVVCQPSLNVPDTAIKFLSPDGCSQLVKFALPYIYSSDSGSHMLQCRPTEPEATESKHYFVKKINHYGFRQKRLIWLELLTFNLHISDLSMRNHKIYEMKKLAHFVKRGNKEKKLSILFTEGSNQKDLHLVFSSTEELQEFFSLAESALVLKQDTKFQIKKTLFFTQQLSSVRKPGKIQRHYSWLNQESTDSVLRMSESEYFFNVVVVSFLGYDRRILVVNRIGKEMRILTQDGKAMKAVQLSSLLGFTHDLEDSRKLTIVDEQATKHILVFPTVQLKILFCSVVYSVNSPETALLDTEKQLRKTEIKIFVCTWNLGHCSIPSDDTFKRWIAVPEAYGLIALGFQECKKSKRAKWLQALTQYLESHGHYLVSFIPMWEMFLVIFTQNTLKISHLDVLAKPTGIAKMIGNKGGVVATFKIEETSFCFLSCHLAAQPHHVLQRNQNAKDLLSMRLGHEELDFYAEYDYLFWFGDLNYRLDKEFSEAVELLKANEFRGLWMYDQLLKEQQGNRAFVNFKEGRLDFMPSYRLRRTDNQWSNKRNQTPSWTDRVLYRTHKKITLLRYESNMTCLGSDHRPVVAEFAVQITPWFLPHTLPSPGSDPIFAAIEFKELEICCEESIGATHGQASFFAPFLQSTPSTPQFAVTGPDVKMTLGEKQIPILTCAEADPRFLREQRIVLVMYLSVKERTDVVGLACLPLEPLAEYVLQTYPKLDLRSVFTSDESIDVAADLESSGRKVGSVRGKWSFNLCSNKSLVP